MLDKKTINRISLGCKVKKLRKLNDIKISIIAEYLGMNSNVTYLSYEQGRSRFTEQMIKKLAGFFNVTVDFLLDDSKKIVIKDYFGKDQTILIKDSKNCQEVINLLKNFDSLDEEVAKAINILIKKILQARS